MSYSVFHSKCNGVSGGVSGGVSDGVSGGVYDDVSGGVSCCNL